MPMRYPHDHENDVIYFAKTNFRNSLRKFGIKTDDRRRHTYVIGKTGMGKTNLLENMIISDIYAGHGCCYVDPHGDTAEKLLDYIPSWRVNDVVYFNPADVQHPVGFNILESVDDDMKHLVAAGMMGVFKKIWENVWSARMEYILNNTILALLDNPGSTLLGINRVLSDKEYRKTIIGNVQDPIVRQFWVKEFAQYQDKFATEAVAPIQNKVGQFLSASIVRNIVAQAKSTINIRQIMDEEKIFIINLSKGRIGEDASRLLGGMLITKIQMSAMERVDTPESDRNDFYLYVDEFQNFAVESFASILSEARKYRLNLIMAHQYIEQLTEEVRDAVFGNVGTMIVFRVGSPDAMFMEDEFKPRFLPEDIINLPKYNIYLKLMIDGVTSQPFSALTLPPIAHRTGTVEKVIEQSRERYAMDRKVIEDHVVEWSGMGGDLDMEKEFSGALKDAKEKRKQKFGHLYNCTRCNKEFSLPVELDRSRPIYCDDCMPIVQKEKEDRKGKGGDRGGRGGGGSGGGGRDREKRRDQRPTAPPKVREGQVVTKDVPAPVGLAALEKKTEKPEKLNLEKVPVASVSEKPVVRDQKPVVAQVPAPVPDRAEARANDVPVRVQVPVQEAPAPRAAEVLQINIEERPKERVAEPVPAPVPERKDRQDRPQREQSEGSASEDSSQKRKRRRRKRNRGGEEKGERSTPQPARADVPAKAVEVQQRPRIPDPVAPVAPGQIIKFD